MTNIHTQLLAATGMAEARTAAIGAYGWFTHARTTDQFDDIQTNGLKPTWPQAFTPPEVIAAIGAGGKNIICLSPYPKTMTLHLNKGGNGKRRDYPDGPAGDGSRTLRAWSCAHDRIQKIRGQNLKISLVQSLQVATRTAVAE